MLQNADAAIAELNGKEMKGRKITISEAREQRVGNDGYRGGGYKKRFNSRQ
ncbi:MAG: hypothetical protein JXA18_14680 [Chitinispirillaceae bacterium]|nr:hypothetical protein [Chitinispirillaceae bacterium]